MAKRNLTKKPSAQRRGAKPVTAKGKLAAEDTEEEKPDAAEGDEDEDKKPDAEDTAPTDEDEEKPEASDEDEEEEETDGDETPASARRAERERIQSILMSPDAKGREGLAMSLAFSTDLDAKTAVRQLQAVTPTGGSGGFEAAMRKVGNPKLGPDGRAGAQNANPIIAAVQSAAPHRIKK